jgi:hypothetical protein
LRHTGAWNDQWWSEEYVSLYKSDVDAFISYLNLLKYSEGTHYIHHPNGKIQFLTGEETTRVFQKCQEAHKHS